MEASVSSKWFTCSPHRTRPIDLQDDAGTARWNGSGWGGDAVPPRTVPQAFWDTVERYGERPALVDEDGISHWTYREYYAACWAAGRSLVAFGVSRFDVVGIMGHNCVPYVVAQLGGILAGALPAGLYPTSSEANCRYILQHARAPVVFVECGACAERVLTASAHLPQLRVIVVWPRSGYDADADAIAAYRQRDARVCSWEAFCRRGAPSTTDTERQAPTPEGTLSVCSASPPDPLERELRRRQASTAPADACCLIYTSGTTGVPKAAMLSHDNINYVVEMARRLLRVDQTWRSVSYLPLSHVAANMLDVMGPVGIGFTVHFAGASALQPGSNTLVRTLRRVQPHFFVGVPRVWEKMAERMQRVGRNAPAPMRWLSGWAKQVTLGHQQRLLLLAAEEPEDAARPSWQVQLAYWLVLRQVHRALGLSECRILVSSAAPLSSCTADYFLSLGMRLCDLYGLSECTGPVAVNLPNAYRHGTSGRAVPGARVRIDPHTGELLVRGRHVFLGYLHNEADTAAVFTADGYLRTGDLAHIDADGFITITGRLKELLVTAGGENVAPAPIEAALERCLPAVSKAMVVGDGRKYLTCLLSLQCGGDAETLVDEAAAVDPELTTAAEVSRAVATQPLSAWHAYVQRGLAAANADAVSRAARVQKAYVLPRAVTVEGGELTPTLKLRRAVLLERYRDAIDRMYYGE
eukprot:ctg_1655.g551